MWNDAIDWNFGFFKWDCQKKNLNVWSWSQNFISGVSSLNFASAMDRGSSRQFSPMHFNLSLGTSAVEYLAFIFIKIENFYLKIPSKFIDETVWNGEKKQMGIKVARFSNCMEGIDSCTENLISPWWFVGTQSRFHHVIDYESQKSALPHVGSHGNAQCNNRSLATAFGLLIGRKFSLNQSGSR